MSEIFEKGCEARAKLAAKRLLREQVAVIFEEPTRYVAPLERGLFSVNVKYARKIAGRKGWNILEMRRESGATVEMSGQTELGTIIIMTGSRKDICFAKRLVQEQIDDGIVFLSTQVL